MQFFYRKRLRDGDNLIVPIENHNKDFKKFRQNESVKHSKTKFDFEIVKLM
jgi:hypothetical protein